MNGKVIRYRKPGWKNWATLSVRNDEYEKVIENLLSLGYEVEGR